MSAKPTGAHDAEVEKLSARVAGARAEVLREALRVLTLALDEEWPTNTYKAGIHRAKLVMFALLYPNAASADDLPAEDRERAVEPAEEVASPESKGGGRL